jgi:hypothetical protein
MPVGSKEIVIGDWNYQHYIDPHVDGEKKKCGTVPRDWAKSPHGSLMHAKPFDLPLIPRSEWQSRLDAQIAAKAQLSDVRNQGYGGKPIPSRDQNGKGYCWAHSSTSAAMICRAIMNEPYADLSAYMVACIIKGYADEGGWGAESLEFIAENGIPDSKFWPQQSMRRSNDNADMRADAAKHKYTDWRDLDPSNMKAQLVTCLLMGFPVVTDFNWWSHSVCTIDLVSLSPFRTRIWNSWGDSWSENGTGVLEGDKAIPDSALCAIVMTPSPA